MRVRGCRVRRSAQAQHATVLCGSAVGQGFEGFSRRSRSRKCEQLPASLTAKLLRAAVARHHRRVVDATRRALPCRGRVNDMTVGATIRGICLATSGPGILRPQHLCVALGTRRRSHEGVFHGFLSGWRSFLRGRNGAQRQHTVVMRTRGTGSLQGHYGPSGPHGSLLRRRPHSGRRNVTNNRDGRTPCPASDGVRPVELRLSQRILHQKDVPEQRQGCGNDASHLLFAAQDDDRHYDEREAPEAE